MDNGVCRHLWQCLSVVLIFFLKTHLCDADFLVGSCCNKNKYHIKIKVEKEMRMDVANLIPRYEKLGSA